MAEFQQARWALPFVVITVLVSGSVMALMHRGAQPALHVTIVEEASGERTPVRVQLKDSNGRAAGLPEQAISIMYGMWDHADGYGYQPDSSFYVDGSFDLALDAGTYVLSITKGNEFLEVQDTLHVSGTVQRKYEMVRWIDAAAMGWYSADDHIHIRRSPREDPLLTDWIAAEDIRVGNLLRMGDFWEKYYSQYAFGRDGVYRESGYMLVSGQEDPRTPELGHVIGLGASKFVRFPDRYYFYDLVFDSLRALGGVGGYAHQAETFHGYRGLTLDGLRAKVDLLEVVQFCAPGGPLITEHYYHLLNLGIPVTATAGSDFPWCGKAHDGTAEIPIHENAQIGNARFYTFIDGDLTYESWMEAVRAGRTFASSGPLLFLEVDGRKPGTFVDVEPGDSVHVRVIADGHSQQIPLETVEILSHGRVMAAASSGDAGQSRDRVEIELSMPVQEGMWIAARAEAGPTQVAHTTPVYVTVDGGGFHDPNALDSLLDHSELILSELEHVTGERHEHVDHQAWRYRDGLLERIEATRGVIDRMRGEQ